MPDSEPPSTGLPPRLRPRVKVWLEAEGSDFGFGSGLIAILEAVDRLGSIKEAAGDQGRSYRHVWARIKRAEQALGMPLVETRVGGPVPNRSDLTGEARRIVREFRDLRARMIAALERESSAHRP